MVVTEVCLWQLLVASPSAVGSARKFQRSKPRTPLIQVAADTESIAEEQRISSLSSRLETVTNNNNNTSNRIDYSLWHRRGYNGH